MTGSARQRLGAAGVYVGANLLAAAVPFLLLPILTRYLAPDEYGQVAMFQVVVSALAAVVGLNAAGAANRRYYDGEAARARSGEFIGACLQILAVTALAALLLLWLLAEPLADALGLPLAWLPWAACVSAATALVALRLGQWQVRGRPAPFGALQIAQALLNGGLSLLLVIGFALGAEGRIGAIVLATSGAGALALLLLLRAGLARPFTWRPAMIREALAFGVPLVPHAAAGFLLSAVDRVVVNDALGIAAVGAYAVAIQLTSVMHLMFTGANNAYAPWLLERLAADVPASRMRIVRLTYLGFLGALVLAAGVVLVGPWLVVLLAGPRYAGAAEVVGWLALGQSFGGMYYLVTNYVFHARRTGGLALVTVLSGALNLLLLLWLVPSLGLRGAGIAFALAMAVRFLLTWRLAQVSHPMPWLRALVGGGAPREAG